MPKSKPIFIEADGTTTLKASILPNGMVDLQILSPYPQGAAIAHLGPEQLNELIEALEGFLDAITPAEPKHDMPSNPRTYRMWLYGAQPREDGFWSPWVYAPEVQESPLFLPIASDEYTADLRAMAWIDKQHDEATAGVDAHAEG